MCITPTRLLVTLLLTLIGCGSDPGFVAPSPCAPGDAFLLATHGQEVRVVCAHSDGTFDTFGDPLPAAPEQAAEVILRFDEAATRAIAAGPDAVWAGDGGSWRVLGPGSERWRQVSVSADLDTVALVSGNRSSVVSFAGEVRYLTQLSHTITVSDDGAYFVVAGSCSLHLHDIADGSERELLRHGGCGSVERADVVRTFATSLLLFEDDRFVYRDLRGQILSVEDLPRLSPYLRSARHQVTDAAIWELRDRQVAPVLPAPAEIDATHVVAIEPDELALVARVSDMPKFSLLASDGSVVDTYLPAHEGYDFWVNLFGDVSTTAGAQRFSLYRLLLGGGGPVPPDEVAVDLIRHDDSGIDLVQRLHQGPGWPPAAYRFTADGSGMWRLRDGALTLIDLSTDQPAGLPTLTETIVGSEYTFVGRDSRGWL